MPYPEVAQETAETWTPPGIPQPISDDDGHPLTWGKVLQSHNYLVTHASCAAAADAAGPSGYDSDDADGDAPGPCPCLWHPVAIEERASCLDAVTRWSLATGPGHICGSCWAASCACGYTLDDPTHAAGRDFYGRLVCHSATCANRATQPGANGGLGPPPAGPD